jgi:luciferase family oxidoreductase group 1
VALARGGALLDIAHYPTLVAELLQYLDDDVPAGSPFASVRAGPRPAAGSPPIPVWVLASSVDGASYAAHFGLPLSWAYFITTLDGAPVLDAYRRQFRPSTRTPEPRSNLGVSVICADDEAAARRVASSVRLWRARGLAGPIPSIDEADHAAVGERFDRLPGRQPMVVGGPERCAEELHRIAARHGTDEVLVVSICHRHEDRVRSYELLAAQLGLPGRLSPGRGGTPAVRTP